MFDEPFSQVCENNKQPILKVLSMVLVDKKKLLEIGSGTGQHAAYSAPRLSHLQWYTSDMPNKHLGITGWIREVTVDNLHPPLALTIGTADASAWPTIQFDAVFTANTTHIMQPLEAQAMMHLVANNLPSDGIFCQYGPYTFHGRHSSDSNKSFNQHIIEQGCGGIRDVDELMLWANTMTLKETVTMPANNFMLIWQKT
jgi:cyclopropane fatty-acyl-phospholipid synthase-like methyltransferase